MKSFLLVLACSLHLALSLAGQGDPAAGQSQPEVGFTREFGKDGEPGSFRARFSRLGGGVVWMQTMDHYRSIERARAATHTGDDYMALVENGSLHALALHGAPEATRFPVDLAAAEWQVSESADGLRFSLASGQGLELVKVLRHEPGQRGFVVELVLRNTGAEPGGNIAFSMLGPALVNPPTSMTIGNSSVAIAVPTEGKVVHVGPSAGVVQPLQVDLARLSFAGSTSRFFAAFLYPRDEAASKALTSLLVETGPPLPHPEQLTGANTVTWVRYGLSLPVPERNAESKATFGLYLGPKSYGVFDTLAQPERFAPILDLDLNPPCCGIDVPGGKEMAKLLLRMLGWFHGLVGNWGLAIIMLTVLVRGLLAPLNFRMQKSMRAYGAKMAVLKPKLDAMKERYADDPKAYQQAMLAFQRENKMIPPLGGCLPIFLTMPIYIGLFTALRTAYELRQQPFLFWMQDLSLADQLFDLPFWPHHINLLPVVWIGLFLWMQMKMPLPTDPQQRQVQSIMRFMPILFGVMLYGYASALMVYMVTSMVWSHVESAITKRILGPMDPNVASMAPTPM